MKGGWIQPNSHAVRTNAKDGHPAHAGHAFELVFEIKGCKIIQEERVEFFIGGGQRDDLQDGGGFRAGHDPLALHAGGKLGDSRRDAVLDKNLGGIRINSDIERHDEVVVSLVGGKRLHVDHPLHAVHRLFDGQGHLFDHRSGTGAGIRCRDLNRRGSDRGVLRNGEHPNRHAAEEHHHKGDDI